MKPFRFLLAALRRLRYPGSIRYWERRYARSGHSGSGSTGVLAAYKAEWLNTFVRERGIRSVVEFGCGDGRQLQLAEYPSYRGLDVAPSAIRRCQALFRHDPDKHFSLYDPYQFDPAPVQAELALSLEVIFHLTEDALYRLYLQHLFASARNWVIVFSPDETIPGAAPFPHFRPRRFTPDVPAGGVLEARAPNPHREISMSDFFVFRRRAPDRLRHP